MTQKNEKVKAQLSLETAWKTVDFTLDISDVDSDWTFAERITTKTNELELLDSLPTISKTSGDFQIKETIGEGGMGVVKRAYQATLGRNVAIKSLKEQQIREKNEKTYNATKALLREAWVTGTLEHPNIIPVHILGVDHNKFPIMVMKRVDGVPWTEIIENPYHPIRQKDGKSIIQWHLDVFKHVCHAVHFAHSRGIIHRDLKPDNVMIGAFGEVYVLDWGIAVAIDESVNSGIPRAHQIREIVGSAHYMAPEMAAANGAFIGQKTDVYLLAATLYHALTGHSPHDGDSIMMVLIQAHLSEPLSFPDHIDQELADICNKAMSRAPADRFENVDQLRIAIENYQMHLNAGRLIKEAKKRIEVLQKNIKSSAPHEIIGQTFSECRFGLQMALREWPESVRASTLLHDVMKIMTTYALDNEELFIARTLIAEIEDPVLQDRFQKLEIKFAELDQRFNDLEQFKENMDITKGQRTRAKLALYTSIDLAVIPLILGWAIRAGYLEFSYSLAMILSAFFMIILLIGIWTWKNVLLSTRINRKIVGAVFWWGIIMLFLPIGIWTSEIEPNNTISLLLLLSSLFIGTLAVAIDLKLFWGAGIFLVIYILSGFFPNFLWEWLALANGLGTLAIAIVWTPETYHPELLLQNPHIKRKIERLQTQIQEQTAQIKKEFKDAKKK